MNKVYLVAYKSKDGKSINKVKGVLSLIGKTSIWVDTGKIIAAFVMPEDEKMDARGIRNKLNECINPFNEGVAAIEVNELDMANTDSCPCFVFEKKKTSIIEKNEPRNFQRFKTRHEACVAYEVEKPIWTYPDNIGNVLRMDMAEWLWMPIKKDGRYEHGKYEKYLD